VVKQSGQKAALHVMPLLRTEWSLLLHAIIDKWIIPFAAYTTAETPNAFQLARQPPKLPLPMGISTISNTCFLSTMRVSPKTASPQVPLFFHTHKHDTYPTDRRTTLTWGACTPRRCIRHFLGCINSNQWTTTTPTKDCILRPFDDQN